ncbi:Sec1-like protein [Amylocarpus encephaloides]|uniref:Sec1-like protein n=1 Tax=Amylocarpus encephaloides TaxID=45428 RepID=A0A9P7YTG3_9HELO|nr:Sec1-like protein [Amylocarpus encephaloides]
MASSHTSLRERQIRSIERMLNLNHESEESEPDHEHNTNGIAVPSAPLLNSDGDPIWKVLVFDDLGRDVISSVLRVNDLRAWGVTMHMHLASARHPIPDVPVLYLVEPTPSNLQSITADLSRGLYSPAYINFLSSIPRPLLEEFARQTAEAGTSETISQFYDQYLNFIVGEPDLFSLGLRTENAYSVLNSGRTTDEQLDSLVDRIVSGLFSVMATMAVMPIIRCPKSGAAEMIAAKLDRKLRDHILNSKDNLFSAPASRSSSTPSSRPVLILLDRNVDLIPMLSHSWTYQSLVHDVLNMKLNRITVENPVDEENPVKGKSKKAYDLTSNDFFWTKNASVPFPQVAEDIDAELSRYKEDANEITRKTGASSIEDLQNDTSASAQHLKAAITLLPELRERKAVLDMHMNILAGLLTGIKNRQLDSYFQMEENIMKQTKAQILEVINDVTKGKEPMDKLRLYIIWYLSTEQLPSRTELESLEQSLKEAGVDTSCLTYIKQVRQLTKSTMMATSAAQTTQQPSASNQLFSQFSGISSRLTSSLKESGVGANFDNLISGVKNFLPANRDLTVTKITESIMDPAGASSSAIAKTEDYLYFDPRSANARGTMPPPSVARKSDQMPGGMGGHGPGTGATFGQRRQGFSEAIVFTVGGGSMDEYGNLQEWAKRTGAGGSGAEKGAGRRRVVYGSTELINAEDFLRSELGKLGEELA